MGNGERLVATTAATDALSADATAVVAATFVALGFKPTAFDTVEAANKSDAAGSSVLISWTAPFGLRRTNVGLVADMDLATTARARRRLHARRRLRTGDLGGRPPVARLFCGAHRRAFLRRGGVGAPDVAATATAGAGATQKRRAEGWRSGLYDCFSLIAECPTVAPVHFVMPAFV